MKDYKKNEAKKEEERKVEEERQGGGKEKITRCLNVSLPPSGVQRGPCYL